MYTELSFKGIYHIDHVIIFKGETGKKGSKRGERKKPTKEEMNRWNHRKKVERLKHVIQANFVPGDYYLTLKYPKGERPSMEKVKKDFTKFRELMKKHYKKHGLAMKYIYRIEIGKRGGIHLHVIMNRVQDGFSVLNRCWRKARGVTELEDMIAEETGQIPDMVTMDGKVDVENLYLEGGYQELAEYMCKPLPDDVDIREEDKKELLKIGSSRNLIRPEPEEKTYTRRTVETLKESGPEKINTDPALRKRFCAAGCLIDKTTWKSGVNPFTGMSYICYTEYRLRRRDEKNNDLPKQRHKKHPPGKRTRSMAVCVE